ncbi:molybdenum ABC transporter ATP-binding protein [Rubrivivax albus]|uniref:Molybdenum ABC transporter ATP-binding protein n=1 Tax=Rubrivivax albus TaxID=2499835 RepID=A0A437JS70_9BURK|nr:molybdenum ABC transporter ATP-binding protein [Rubrivivax albus]RVT49783.1 molybdenum ABC transporter ATP-binding protein [Rubrivivax albus]
MIDLSLRLARRDFTLDVALPLPMQGVTALFGPSGCGKTTLLRALAGLERAAGRVALGDEVWQDDAAGRFVPPHQRSLGYVIQESALFPHLDVAANLAYGRRRAGADGARVDLPALVDLLGIGALMARRPATLSGGERQRVAIARALATGPQLLLMDEPLAALDAPRKAEILPYLERLSRTLALPVVYVTHAIDEVARLADHLLLLDAGRVRAAGPLHALLARPDLAWAGPDEAGVVIDATVAAHDEAYGLSQVRFAGGTLWLGRVAREIGAPVRVRVPARDVSLVVERPARTSILNVLPGVVTDVHAQGQTATVRLVCGQSAADTSAAPLLARVTRRSAEALQLHPGQVLFAQIKSVSLM